MKLTEESITLEKAIEQIKNTNFYKEYIDKLYICEEDRDRIVYSSKKVYSRQIEEQFLEELGGNNFPYILFDECFMDYLENGLSALTIKEV